MLDIKQVAKELSVCERTVRTLIKNGKIKATRIGNQYRISEEEVKRLKGE
jgi:excisionase family DNA binding protein